MQVMFCDLTPIQKQIYQRILQLPEYQNLVKKDSPCDCGINKRFFAEYIKLGSERYEICEKFVDYYV